METATNTRDRLVSIDLARCVALLSMFVAYTAPSPGPGAVLDFSEFLATALFAMLIGVSSDLSADHMRFPVLFASSVVRALAFICVGIWADSWGAQVDIVLPYLGLLSLLMAVLVYLPTWLLGALTLIFWWLGPWAMTAFAEVGTHQTSPFLHTFLLWMFEGSTYRVFTMLVWGCTGVVLIRLMRTWGLAGDVLGALVLTLISGGLWWGAGQYFELFPYTGNRWEVGFDLLLAAAVICWCSLIARIFGNREHLLDIFTVAGRMTLSLYLLQIALLGLYASYAPRFGFSSNDDSWWMMSALIILSLLFAYFWNRLLASTFAARGPAETLLSWVSGRG